MKFSDMKQSYNSKEIFVLVSLFICLIILTGVLFMDLKESIFGKMIVFIMILLILGIFMQIYNPFETQIRRMYQGITSPSSPNTQERIQQSIRNYDLYNPSFQNTPQTNQSLKKISNLKPPRCDDYQQEYNYHHPTMNNQDSSVQENSRLENSRHNSLRKESFFSLNSPNLRNLYSSSPSRRPNQSVQYQKKKNLIQDENNFQNINEDFKNKAIDTFKKLGIESAIRQWISNCEKFVFNILMLHALNGIHEQISKANQFLNEYYRKRLIEADIFNKDQQRIASQFQAISIDELFTYEKIQSLGQLWPIDQVNTVNLSEIKNQLQNHVRNLKLNNLFYHIKVILRYEFEYLFVIKGYSLQHTRNYLIKRLLHLYKNPQNMEYHNGVRNNKQYPTDSEIITHLFMALLRQISERAKDSNMDRNYLLDRNTNLEPKKDDVFFKQINPEMQEPHYIILSGENDQWYTLPGKDNILCAIVLFLYHLKKKITNKYGEAFLSDGIKNIIEKILTRSYD